MYRFSRYLSIGSLLLLSGANAAERPAELPRIAVFSGPSATIQNNQPFITSIKARQKHGLPPLRDAEGRLVSVDVLRPQRLAAPVTLYVEQFSAHPLERDVAELYGPPDGYIDARGDFHKERTAAADKPVYEVTLAPQDGLYPLPYMAVQADGNAWEGNAVARGAPFPKSRQTFYPDASRIFEEIERLGANLGALAAFDFIRAAPAGGYTKGLPEKLRTDLGKGDIPPEQPGVDFFQYGAYPSAPPRAALAKATNIVQKAMSSGKYAGGIWLEGSVNIEDSAYWMSLVIDTPKPLAFNSSQRTRGSISPDGDANIINSVKYILSDAWADEQGRDRIGVVNIQDDVIYSAREITKGDARPGGYVAAGGFGGYLGDASPLTIAVIPNRKHTHTSEVRYGRIPDIVQGIGLDASGSPAAVSVPVKDAAGELLPGAIPHVFITKSSGRWSAAEAAGLDDTVDLTAQVAQALREAPLSGIAAEGNQGGGFVGSYEEALDRAAASGLPVVKVSRGNPAGYIHPNPDNLTIEGSNLTATKARLLLMACLMRFGALPPSRNPAEPTTQELAAIKDKLKLYQAVFDSH